jgi:hypothetical protein
MSERVAERFGGIGGIVIKITHLVLGIVWSVLTVFVVSVLVYENLSLMKTVRRYKGILEKTWGESLVRSLDLGIIRFVCILITIRIIVRLGIVMPQGMGSFLIVVFGIVSSLGIILVLNVVNTILNIALYVYANTVEEPGTVTINVLASAFKPKG